MSVMSPDALPLAKRVLDRVTARPDQFNMSDWMDRVPGTENDDDFCGTSACIAGWAMILSGEYEIDEQGLPIVDGSYEVEGARLLGLELDEVNSPITGLFYCDSDAAVERLAELIAEAESVT